AAGTGAATRGGGWTWAGRGPRGGWRSWADCACGMHPVKAPAATPGIRTARLFDPRVTTTLPTPFAVLAYLLTESRLSVSRTRPRRGRAVRAARRTESKGEAGGDAQVAAGERGVFLEEAGVTAGDDIEDVVRRERDAASVARAERMEGERCVDHRIALGRSLQVRDALLIVDPFDLEPAVHGFGLRLDAGEKTERRDSRRRADVVDRRSDIVGDSVEIERDLADRRQPGRGLELDSVIAGVALAGPEHGQAVLHGAGRLVVDVAVEPAVEERGREAESVAGAVQGRLEAPALLGGKAGVADLEGLRSRVRPVGEQFLGRGRALATGEVEAEAKRACQSVARAERAGEDVEMALQRRIAEVGVRVGLRAAM